MTSKKPVVLVTGGDGLIGKGIEWHVENKDKKDKNLEQYEWVHIGVEDGDLRDKAIARKMFEKYRPTFIIHLAAKVGGLYNNMKYPVQMFNDNIAMNGNVLALAHEFKVKKVISMLSTCIFPDAMNYPIREEDVQNGPPHDSNFAYAYAKRMVKVLSDSYNKQYGTHFATVIPTNVFGPHDNYHIEDGHVIPENNEPYVIWGTGKPLRQFIFSRDIGGLLVWALRNYEGLDPIILSVGEEDEISIKDAAMMVAEAAGVTNIIHDTSKDDGQFKKTACNDKLMRLYPSWQPTPIKEAIKTSVDWFFEHYEEARK